MGMKIDRFTWGIILGVLRFDRRRRSSPWWSPAAAAGRTDDYLNEDTPEAVVHDAFLASVRNEPDIAFSHHSQDSFGRRRRTHTSESVSPTTTRDRPARRLRILDVDIDEDEDKAYVTVAIDNFRQGGLFESGTSTYRRTVPLVREDGAWKIDTDDLFY